MTRRGKIARLPKEIRDELNRRLDNGEPGVDLLQWLNELPEVKQSLEKHFDGRPIAENNLCDWKKGGFLEWRGQRETQALTQQMLAGAIDLDPVAGPTLTNCLAGVVAARFAELVFSWDGEVTDEFKRKLEGLRSLSIEVARMRRGELARERTQIQRDAFDLKREMWEFEAVRVCRSKLPDLVETEEQQWTNYQKEEAFRAILFPKKHLDFADTQATNPSSQSGNEPTPPQPDSAPAGNPTSNTALQLSSG